LTKIAFKKLEKSASVSNQRLLPSRTPACSRTFKLALKTPQAVFPSVGQLPLLLASAQVLILAKLASPLRPGLDLSWLYREDPLFTDFGRHADERDWTGFAAKEPRGFSDERGRRGTEGFGRDEGGEDF